MKIIPLLMLVLIGITLFNGIITDDVKFISMVVVDVTSA